MKIMMIAPLKPNGDVGSHWLEAEKPLKQVVPLTFNSILQTWESRKLFTGPGFQF